MSTRFAIFAFFILMSGSLLGGIFDAQGPSGGRINEIVQFQIFRQAEINFPLLPALRFPVPNTAWFSSMAGLITWNFSFFEGSLNYLRWMIWLPLTFGFIVSLLLSLFSSRLMRG